MAYTLPADASAPRPRGRVRSDRYRPTRDLRRDPPAPPTDRQVARLRDAEWLRQHEVEGRPIRLIARIAEAKKSRVQNGIDRARQLREALADAARRNDDRT